MKAKRLRKSTPPPGVTFGRDRLVETLCWRLPGLTPELARHYVDAVFDTMREALLAREKVSIRDFAVWRPKGWPRKDGRAKGRPWGLGISCRTDHVLRLAVDPSHIHSTHYTWHRERSRLRERARRAAKKLTLALCLGACVLSPRPTSSSSYAVAPSVWRPICGMRWRALTPLRGSPVTAAPGRLIPGEGCPSGWPVSSTTSTTATARRT